MDNGSTWKEIFLLTDAPIISSIFLTENYLFAGTYYDGVFRSADGGLTWERTISVSSDNPIIGMARDKNSALSS
jgi:hypothetical protein